MFFDKFIGRQLANPSGIISWYFAISMNRNNNKINRTTVELLDIKSTDKVLEIGFGGGEALNEMTKLVDSGLISGIEVSDAMLKRGSKRFHNLISQGKMELKKGISTKIPYEDSFFDKICSINCIYFWPNPVIDLKEIFRALKKEGKFIVSIYDKEKFSKFSYTKYGFTLYSNEQLQDFLHEAGFSDIHFEHRQFKPLKATFVIAIKK